MKIITTATMAHYTNPQSREDMDRELKEAIALFNSPHFLNNDCEQWYRTIRKNNPRVFPHAVNWEEY